LNATKPRPPACAEQANPICLSRSCHAPVYSVNLRRLPRLRRLRDSRRAQGGTPPACEADGDDVGTARRKCDDAAQRWRSRRPPSASRRRERNRRRAAPRAAGRHRRMRRGADLATSVTEGRAVKPRTGDGAPRRCKGCARSGRHAECPVEMDAARRPRPGGWTGVRRRGLRTQGCAISTGRRGAAAGARFQTSHAHREAPRAPQPRRLALGCDFSSLHRTQEFRRQNSEYRIIAQRLTRHEDPLSRVPSIGVTEIVDEIHHKPYWVAD
jgi:hypothetical protein